MELNWIVKRYIDAWNQLDSAGLLELMHPGAAYYDAFWMETCVGRGLAQYFQDAMNEEPFWYVQVGDTINTENGVIFRYSAHEREGRTIGDPILFGAEILCLQDDKILTVTDIYCNSDRASLEEVAELAARRHGLPSHVNYGLGAMKEARIKANLSARIDKIQIFLDPGITINELAEKLDCTTDQLSVVIEKHFGVSFRGLVDIQRVEYAKNLLESYPDGDDFLEEIAISAGFESVSEFDVRFTQHVGVKPTDYVRQQKGNKTSQDESNLH